jgi:hypothetical protein
VRLDDPQIELYSRQILLRELGGVGQLRLLRGRCAAVGAGIGLEVALTYLAGAGVGTIDILSSDDSDRVGDRSAFAPLTERSPDLECKRLVSGRPVTLDAYDVLLLALARSDEASCSMSGSPRKGAVRIDEEDAAVRVVLVPAAAEGCFACVGVSRATDASAARSPCIALGMAGSMAAVAACRWIAEISRDEPSRDAVARAFRLAHDAATFEEMALERRIPCPRGCPG